MKSKLMTLILFTSVISVAQICSAITIRQPADFQELRATNFGESFAKNEKTSGVTISGKAMRGSTLVSGATWGG